MSGSTMSFTKRSVSRKIKNEPLTCKPLDSFKDIMSFLENPPPWRTLCKELTPHSKFKIQNKDVGHLFDPSLETPEHYCHFDPDVETPIRYDVSEKKLPKTLVCHDFANGYHDDCIIDGTQDHEAYTFYNWAGIDIFCYFSHHLITIPPVGWINVGHAHGVKVIGTIITEWTEGVQFWDAVLVSQSSYRNFASAVVAFTKTLKFDGWLLNVENKVSKPDMLLEFVHYLHKTLHQELDDPVLIWYDSVTINGNLNWQNGLNEKNKAFFEACDGFFTNYSWTETDVLNSAVQAGDRLTDLFIGIDVWGRNFYGGGQFNTQEAIKVAHREGCSLAIFAPAWTYEAMSNDPKDPNYISLGERLSKKGMFALRDRALWGSIWPFLSTRLPCELPFQTSFCRGLGKKRRMYGEVISPGPWYNLRHQQYQPNSAHGPHGYMLSTYEKIMEVTAVSVQKDKKGIIRYRQSFQMIRNELNSIRPDAALAELDSNTAPRRRDSFISYRSEGSEYAIDPESREAKESPDEPVCNAHLEPDTEVDNNTETICNQETTTNQPDDMPSSPKIKRKLSTKLKELFERIVHKSQPELDFNNDETKQPKDDYKKDETSKLKNEDTEFEFASTTTTWTVDNMTEGNSSAGVNVSAGTSSLARADVKDVTDTQTEEVNEPPELKKSMVVASVNLKLKPPQLKTRWALAYVEKEKECLQVYYSDSFHGGSSLLVNPSDRLCSEHRVTRLFHCDFLCKDALIICVVTKTLGRYPDQTLDMKLRMEDSNNKEFEVMLLGSEVELPSSDTYSLETVYVEPVLTEDQQMFRELRQYLILNEPDFYVPIENLYGWETRYYIVKAKDSRVTSINCRTSKPQGGILLGHFGICALKNVEQVLSAYEKKQTN